MKASNATVGLVNSTHFHGGKGWRKPRVYFLFLAVDKISNLDVWSAYFQNIAVDEYRAFVHCKEDSCKEMVKGSPILPVPTVGSYYCTDLVSPMNALIDHALKQDEPDVTNQADKFVFLSDSTLPAKPFSFIWSTLTMRPGSDFCVFPSTEWVDIETDEGLQMVPKSHQWVTLTRSHAEKSVELWASGHRHDFMSTFRMNKLDWSSKNNTFGDSRNYGCLDEFWYMLALFGPIKRVNADIAQTIPLAEFTGGSLNVASWGQAEGWQGECDTFVLWSSYMMAGNSNPFEMLYRDLDPGSKPHWGNGARPGWWDAVTERGMKAFRESDFLFIRKFVDKPKLHYSSLTFAQAYARNVFY